MRDIPGLEGRYAINEDGTKILSHPKPRKMWQGGIGWTKERFLSIHKTGLNLEYSNVTLSVKYENGRKSVKFLIHRLVAMTFIGLPNNNKLQVNHKDMNPSNNHYSNLEWVTPKENSDHAWQNGRKAKKWKEGRIRLPKLPIEKIKEVYKLYSKGTNPYQISFKMNLSFSTIYKIVNKKGCYALPIEELEKRMNEKR